MIRYKICPGCERFHCACMPPAESVAALLFAMVVTAIVCLALLLSGCEASTQEARVYVDGADLMVKAWAPTLRRECTGPLDDAVATAEAMPPGAAREEYASVKRAALYAKGCGEAITSYDLLRTGVETAYVTLDTIEAGECVGVSRSVETCNLDGLRARVTKLLGEAADKMARIEREAQ